MTRKHRVANVLGLGSLPLTPVVDRQRETLKSFTRAEEARIASEKAAEQKGLDDERMKPIRALENEIKVEGRKMTDRVKKFFSLPLQKMADFSFAEVPVDYVGDYPSRKGERD